MFSFDNSPTVYWFIGYLLAGFVIFASQYESVPKRAYLAAGIILLIFMRIPVVVFNRELNVDESQMLSHAITLFQDPVYWRSVDGTTIGPLDNYLLVVPKLLGFRIDYTSGRFMGLLCVAGAWLLLCAALKNWFGTTAARRISIVPLLFLAFTQEVDFIHYSSEQLPVFLLAFCVFQLSRLDPKTAPTASGLYWLGLAAGAVPFGKLQAAPLAIVLVLGAFAGLFQRFKRYGELKSVLALVLGGLTVPLFFLAFTLSFGVFDDLIDFYILGNAIYAGGATFADIPAQFYKIVALSTDFQLFTLALIIPMLIGLVRIVRLNLPGKMNFHVPFTILFLLLASIYAVTKSGNAFIHYLNFCIIPWTLLAAYGLSAVGGWSLVFPAVMVLWFGGNDALHFMKERRLNAFDSVEKTALRESPVVTEILKRREEGDYMIVWGWNCSYYVEAQLAEGTAENHSERSIFAHPMREVYRKRYMSDLERTKPAFVADAVGRNSLWVQDKKTQGIESYPELNQYIRNHYTLLGEYDDVRLYVRNDRVARH
ncbi:hypothetical protein GCM10010967_51490 [Dyadobacter beijingensis]|uniref:Dolichyl-phosphate-mannose-protein mannosyltransferase n=1 Tax=Dyadobacter beijingensis TaxID=365489 RepID=A0ABQ2IF48_9BACT|nr:hypothetical protein [Dyadobacter beijingensis]GGN09288.1 hypothetical protein GCM10010967_51490 [Dyadobacter beijingensis]